MIVDSSALVAIHEEEADAAVYRHALEGSPRSVMSAATYVECAMVLDRRTAARQSRLDDLLDDFEIGVVAFTAHHARAARTAHQSYGRGTGHRAGLNLGDCFSYALAISEDEPLLFKGDDFTHTDVRDALAELDKG